MNSSGKAVNYWIQYHKIRMENSLIVVDDIALDFGVLRIRAKGSSAGHNGLASVEQFLGTQLYPRLRIGIGNQFQKGAQIDYVLDRFNTDEISRLHEFLDNACDIIHSFMVNGIDKTMTEFNKRQSK